MSAVPLVVEWHTLTQACSVFLRQVCLAAVGLVCDLCRALMTNILPFCDEIMQLLLENLGVRTLPSYHSFFFLFFSLPVLLGLRLSTVRLISLYPTQCWNAILGKLYAYLQYIVALQYNVICTKHGYALCVCTVMVIKMLNLNVLPSLPTLETTLHFLFGCLLHLSLFVPSYRKLVIFRTVLSSL